MSEKFSLKWNDFQSNVSRTFSLLRSEQEFFDVSLVSDDQKTMSAHKLVLSASSPYFRQILTHNKHSHPLLCLDGVSSGELQCVLDYIYQGEVQIYQEQLDKFLEVAQRFKLEGLNSAELPGDSDYSFDTISELPENDPIFVENMPDLKMSKTRRGEVKRPRRSEENTAIVKIQADSIISSEVGEKILENIIKNADGTFSCRLCGKNSGKIATNIKNHVETHIEGLNYPCQTCGKMFRSRNSLNSHKTLYHRG